MNKQISKEAHVSIAKGKPTYVDSDAVTRWVAAALDGLPDSRMSIRPGDRVVLKPNWVKEHDLRFPYRSDSWTAVVTHPSVILGVIRWVAPLLAGKGSITICDAPQADSSFDKLRAYCGLDDLLETCRTEFPGVEFAIFDLRSQAVHSLDGVAVARQDLPGDPAGAVNISLNENSELYGYHGLGRLYGAAYDFAETNRQHRDPHHEYLVCRTPLLADVLINIPKLKTHKKVGMTVALKNMVGITARTNWLPRHTEGTPDQGGDQFADNKFKRKLERLLMGNAKRVLKGRYLLSRLFVPIKGLGRLVFGDTADTIRSGNWHGNDTCWRMILDLHKCILHYNADGQRRSAPPRQLIVVDGLIAGEGDGPMAPDPKNCGIILAGFHPVAVDCVCARLMGFDWRKLRLLTKAFATRRLPLVAFDAGEIQVISDVGAWHGPLERMSDCFSFRPHFGWKGAIEL